MRGGPSPMIGNPHVKREKANFFLKIFLFYMGGVRQKIYQWEFLVNFGTQNGIL